MKPHVIPTAFRTIHLVLQTDDPLSSFEQEALKKYTVLHAETFTLQQKYQLWHHEALDHQNELRKFELEVAAFEKEIQLYNKIAGYSLEQMEVHEDVSAFKLQPQELKKAIIHFEKAFDNFYKVLKQLIYRYYPMDIKHKNYEGLFKEFDTNYFSYMIQNWENMNIDTGSLDKDFGNFRTTLQGMNQLYIDSNNLYDNLLEAYHLLVNRINTVYTCTAQIFTDLDNWSRLLGNEDPEKIQWN